VSVPFLAFISDLRAREQRSVAPSFEPRSTFTRSSSLPATQSYSNTVEHPSNSLLALLLTPSRPKRREKKVVHALPCSSLLIDAGRRDLSLFVSRSSLLAYSFTLLQYTQTHYTHLHSSTMQPAAAHRAGLYPRDMSLHLFHAHHRETHVQGSILAYASSLCEDPLRDAQEAMMGLQWMPRWEIDRLVGEHLVYPCYRWGNVRCLELSLFESCRASRTSNVLLSLLQQTLASPPSPSSFPTSSGTPPSDSASPTAPTSISSPIRSTMRPTLPPPQ
jgi:hypothetical protein